MQFVASTNMLNLDQSTEHDSFKSREKMFVIIRTVGIVIKYVLSVHRGVRLEMNFIRLSQDSHL